MEALARFHPLIGRWFSETMGPPTSVQEEAWARIAQGDHALVLAPTGSGKTMAAFLWAIDRLVTGIWPTGHTSVLYVSPLRALNNDIQRNLLGPLHQVRERFGAAGEAMPRIRVLTRSGDTTAAARRTMVRHPPEILITTPESLNLLLSSTGGRQALKGIRVVVLDEVHAVIGTKRGAYLATAVERLASLGGEFQRIALSATIHPVEAAARFVGGYALEGPPADPQFRPRRVSVVASPVAKHYRLQITYPIPDMVRDPDRSFWDALASTLRATVAGNRSTLLFTNSRRLSERLTLALNRAPEGQHPALAYAHHGSLSREIRHEVEQRLKAGALRAIVATNSLELGIDIGAIDEVILVQSPPSVSSAVQRIGRSGHAVGATSRGTLVPTHPHDLIEAAALVPAVLSRDIETTAPVMCPLDVLAQVIVSMVGVERWDLDALYGALRASASFHDLSRRSFDLVVGMLAGRYADSRLRELSPLISVNAVENSVVARRGALLTLYSSGGVIPDRGYYHLRHEATGARIGELDEEFVWEASVGNAFTLGTQTWRIQRITHNDVFVVPAAAGIGATPFWRGEGYRREFHLSERIGRFLEDANARLDDPGFVTSLMEDRRMDQAAAEALVDFLRLQVDRTGCDLPHRHHVLVEHVATGPGGAPGHQVIIHTGWGLQVNQPLALALGAAWEERMGALPEIYPSNDTIVLVLPGEVTAEEILTLVTAETLDSLLTRRLEGSGIYAARFRECAGRALLLPRSMARDRMPLWMSRLRAQRLFDAVKGYGDFPIILEAWRTCLQEDFDLPNLRSVLTELEAGVIRWSQVQSAMPSPLARGSTWRQVNEYMYMGDQPAGRSGIAPDLVKEIALSPHLRPAVGKETTRRFTAKLQRLNPGYAPGEPREMLDWVRERLMIPEAEWDALAEAVRQDHGSSASVIDPLGGALVRIMSRRGNSLVTSREDAPRVVRALGGESSLQVRGLHGEAASLDATDDDPVELLGRLLSQWLRFYGPVEEQDIASLLGVSSARLAAVLADLEDDGRIIRGSLIAATIGKQVCDVDNFTWILRFTRSESAPRFEPLPPERLPLFLAAHQGIAVADRTHAGLTRRLRQLCAYPAPAALWESEILPARLPGYSSAWLDSLFQEGDIRWIGCGDRRILFADNDDLDLVRTDPEDPPAMDGRETIGSDSATQVIFPDPRGKYDLSTLMQHTGLPAHDLVGRLWAAAWEGNAANDTFLALRRGIETGFDVPHPTPTVTPGRRRGARTAFGRWRGSLPAAGNWYRIPWPMSSSDIIEREERQKDRARILLDRYGILFKALLSHELPQFRWSHMFRSLRIMELSGEVVSGCFFRGIDGLQFMGRDTVGALHHPCSEEVFWLNAADPASLCGVGVSGLSELLPRRLSGTHVVYHGARLVMVSERYGAQLRLLVPDESEHLGEYFRVFEHLLTRGFQPRRRIVVETINGADAAHSPLVAVFRTMFQVAVEHTSVVLYRVY